MHQAEQSTAASRIRIFQQDQSEDTAKKEDKFSGTEKKDTHMKDTKRIIYLEDKTKLLSDKMRKSGTVFFTSAPKKYDFH